MSDSAHRSKEDIAKRSKEIENYLRQEKRAYELYLREAKILILGTSDSGKSTLLKQLKILHGDGFSDKDRADSKRLITLNILQSCHALLQHSNSEMKNACSQLQKLVGAVFAEDIPRPVDILAEDIAKEVVLLWNDKSTQELLKRSNQIALLDSAYYFLADPVKYTKPDYVPTNEDILNIRIVTQCVSDTVFTIERERIHFFDVSGLKHHRKSWVPYFHDVHTILFVASLSCYDQMMAEDPEMNRMVDAIQVFDHIINHPDLQKPNIVLFLNKKDIFQKKVKESSIKKYFEEYNGRKNSVSEGIEFFKKLLLEKNKSGRRVFTHVTCCTDTSSMGKIVNAVMYPKLIRAGVLSASFKNAGIIG